MKPEFMRLRRAVTLALASLIAAVSLAALSPAVSAAANHNTVSVAAACVNNTWTVTWTVTNSEADKSETIVESSQPSLVPVGTLIGAGETITVVEQVAGSINKTLTVKGHWADGDVTDIPRSATVTPYHFTGTCAAPQTPYPPSVTIGVEPCVYGSSGPAGAITVALEGLASGWQYRIQLWSGDTAIETLTHEATSPAFSTTFADRAPGEYRATAQAIGDSPVSTTESVTIADCTPAPTPTPEPTPEPSPSPEPPAETPPQAVLPEEQTRALPSITATPSACNSANLASGTVSVAVAGLDRTHSYYVKLVDKNGDTIPGGSERRITDATSASLSFAGVPAAGAYSAVLLANPRMQLVGDAPVALAQGCLSTLALTGAGVTHPVVSLATLLLGLGTVVIISRLRRRAAR